jgi:hypothetical protein
MKKYILGLLTLYCLTFLPSCNSEIITGWTPYRPAYGKGQKKSKLHHIKMGTTPLTKRNPTH